jgi:hypothetical protein
VRGDKRIKMDVRQFMCEGMGWIQLVYVRLFWALHGRETSVFREMVFRNQLKGYRLFMEDPSALLDLVTYVTYL